MRHRKKNKTLGRDKDQRKHLFRNLSESLVMEEKIQTTLAKAKELRKFVEPLITKAKDNSLAARRQLLSKLGNKEDVVDKLLNEVGPKYKDRPGGYTRIIKLKARDNDGAKRAVIELV
jgi:large subunit ribosomal protein L17